MIIRIAFVLFLAAQAAAAGEAPPALLGTWGTAKQCAGAPLKPGGTVRAAPVTFSDGWLQHGPIWCRMTWFDPAPRADGFFIAGRALCGEDSARGHGLGVVLSGEELTLIWNEAMVSGPMYRCAPTP